MYINFMTEQNKNIYISYWLLLITLFIAVMIVVGGITRLTDSGLSITKWDLFKGIIPPLSLKQWNQAFLLYQEIPEFKLLNTSMNLHEFKAIFWWEYAHRLLGRLIGLVYIFPLLIFTVLKIITKKDLLYFYSIFLLICFQGFIGWYMVKSGLSESTDVSHYRLSLHLVLAFIIFLLLILKYFKLKNKNYLIKKKSLPFYLPLIFTFLILLQISVGALVSGLDAGQIYQTWPLMNQRYFPDDAAISDLFSLGIFEIPSIVQFLHRNIAYFILLMFLSIIIIVFKNMDFFHLRKITLVILLTLLVQIFLGILTVISGAQIILASLHQIGSIFLFATSIFLVSKNSKTS